MQAGKIVNAQDIDRALEGVFKEQTLYMLRELLLRTIDTLTLPAVKAGRTSMAAAFVYPNVEPSRISSGPQPSRTRSILGLEIVPTSGTDRAALEPIARELGGEMLRESVDPRKIGERRSARGARRVSRGQDRSETRRIARCHTTCSSSAQSKRISARIRRDRRIRKLPAIASKSGMENSSCISARRPVRARRMQCWIARISCKPTAWTSSRVSSKRTGVERRRPCSTVWK